MITESEFRFESADSQVYRLAKEKTLEHDRLQTSQKPGEEISELLALGVEVARAEAKGRMWGAYCLAAGNIGSLILSAATNNILPTIAYVTGTLKFREEITRSFGSAFRERAARKGLDRMEEMGYKYGPVIDYIGDQR